MRTLQQFIIRILWVEAGAVIGLFLAGAALTFADRNGYRATSFFTYRVARLDNTPWWFIASLLLVLINGLWLFRLAALEATFRTPHGLPFGEWSASIPVNPLRLLGVNLVCIPVLLTAFLIVRANGW